ncbi:MAG: DUF2787 domain-containing protein [Shewanella sp.]
MTLTIKRNQLPAMPEHFYQVIEKELTDVDPKDANAITLNFRDPDYSAEDGGFHPVEVQIEKQQDHWRLVYVTDFSFHGYPYPELVKEIDICFNSKQVYSEFCGWIPGWDGEALVAMFSDNFVSYYDMEAYHVQISLH